MKSDLLPTTWRCYVQEDFGLTKSVFLIADAANSLTAGRGIQPVLVMPFSLRPIEEGDFLDHKDATYRGRADHVDMFLRVIVDAAWDAGVRPTKFKDFTNELAAVRYHLEDMRLLARVPFHMKKLAEEK